MPNSFALLFLACVLMPSASWAATFTVNRSDDAPDHALGDNVCYAQGNGCTLRAAIEQASALPGMHTIAFDFSGAPTTISIDTSLPSISHQLTIDGYTNGGTPNTLAAGNNAIITVRIDGGNIGPSGTPGLRFLPGASNSVVRGVAITRFTGAGVLIDGQGGSNLTGLTLAGNFVGVDLDGFTPLPNEGDAVRIQNEAAYATAGGSQPADRNLIVAPSSSAGISAFGATSARVAGNFIGTDRTGNALIATGQGLYVGSSDNTMAEHNVIGAQDVGVYIDGGVNHIALRTNRIGVGTDGANLTGANSRHGVFITNGSHDQSPYFPQIGTTNPADGNTIAHWRGNGIRADRQTNNATSISFMSVLGNSIYATVGEGIELIDTATGQGAAPGSRAPNSVVGMSRPTITSATAGVVNFMLTNGPLEYPVRFELFSNTECGASGWGPGRTYLGSVSVSGNGGQYSGSMALPNLPVGTPLTMTATVDYGGQFGTSEFSQCVAIQAGPVSNGGSKVAAVPTMGELGLALLSALLLGVGALRAPRSVDSDLEQNDGRAPGKHGAK
ncbi:IPTL-CTERM sorting domain-containing protein [Ottowia thiooxydans]|uniref:IPTL-CTERM sorting domain-containing protein n=1 Tax=Ottowia thiooxydans TaxID=219182 RepID=UPI00040ADD38|nr:IPTL-CTERM sorting domain-containing protein [Ottowia thiooxydans]